VDQEKSEGVMERGKKTLVVEKLVSDQENRAQKSRCLCLPCARPQNCKKKKTKPKNKTKV
jgi:hypothetical protein